MTSLDVSVSPEKVEFGFICINPMCPVDIQHQRFQGSQVFASRTEQTLVESPRLEQVLLTFFIEINNYMD